ncbi:MAG TPA: hypothetical protein VGV59_13295 [Pyrinomonadaceae bacterium]|nr:hypothetical protein [Pyrinomonadaceae bacterium]
MTETKPRQRKPKLELREPAKPLAPPEARQLASDHPVMEIFRQAAAATPSNETTSQGGTSTTSTTSTTPELPAAPSRDFMKVANSVGRVAVPGGAFTGKGKQLYDYLYSRTRGAIVPTRSARITNRELMDGADIGSEITLRANVRRLCDIGLVKMERKTGTHDGNVYTVFLPEETGTSGTSTTSGTSGTDTSQKLVPLVVLETSTTSTTLNPLDTTSSGNPKTSFKTNTENDDDEAYADLIARLKEATREVTGKDSSPAERARWAEVAEVLALEFRIAAARTSVSSAPAFLAEHLRRRLFKREKGKGEMSTPATQAETQESGLTPDQIKTCPDCGGTNWWYPKGFEGGVSKCRHEKITRA